MFLFVGYSYVLLVAFFYILSWTEQESKFCCVSLALKLSSFTSGISWLTQPLIRVMGEDSNINPKPGW